MEASSLEMEIGKRVYAFLNFLCSLQKSHEREILYSCGFLICENDCCVFFWKRQTN